MQYIFKFHDQSKENAFSILKELNDNLNFFKGNNKTFEDYLNANYRHHVESIKWVNELSSLSKKLTVNSEK
jgi:hypothetical protein